MFRSRLLLLPCALGLLSGCASHPPQHTTSQAQPTEPSAPAVKEPSAPAVKPHSKPAAPHDNNRANPAATNKEGVPAGEAGYFLDVLQGRMRQALDPAVIVRRERGSIVLDLSHRIGFGDEARLDDAGRAVLLSLSKVLGEYRAALVTVRVDVQGDGEIARKLAQQRENAIVRVLIDSGISAARIAAAVPDTAARNGNLHIEILLAPEIRAE
jgi:outer membrane protein OmpA-like peptidoglycan-associated protein